MDLVFPAEHGWLTAGGLPVAESDTQLAHTRPQPFSIYAGLPRWLADGVSVGGPTLSDREGRWTCSEKNCSAPSRSYSCIARNTSRRVTRSHATMCSFLPGRLGVAQPVR